MDDVVGLQLEQLGVSLLLGLLVGLQRQHTETPLAGLRTFPFITVLGTLSATIDLHFSASGVIVAASLIGVIAGAIVPLVLVRRADQRRYGTTTIAAILLMFAVGAYLAVGSRTIGVAVGVGVAVLLQFKPELHSVAEKLGENDMRAIMQFALFTCVVLPILPDQGYGPFEVLNPFNIWLMVVLIVGISLGGYIGYRFLGNKGGTLLGGILGGAISSTATTVSYARRSSDSSQSEGLAVVVVMIATSISFLRVLFEVSVLSPDFLTGLGPPMLVMCAASTIGAAVMWRFMNAPGHELPQHGNPTELKPALLFGFLYALVLLALAAAEHYLGDRGLYAVAVMSGLTDMDAITLSTAGMLNSGRIDSSVGWRLLVAASLSNILFKCGIVALLGTRGLLWRTMALFLLPLSAGVVMLLFWT